MTPKEIEAWLLSPDNPANDPWHKKVRYWLHNKKWNYIWKWRAWRKSVTHVHHWHTILWTDKQTFDYFIPEHCRLWHRAQLGERPLASIHVTLDRCCTCGAERTREELRLVAT